MITAAVAGYLVIGLILARLIIGSQPEDKTRGGAAFMAALLIILLWPLAIAAAAAMALLSVLVRRRDKD